MAITLNLIKFKCPTLQLKIKYEHLIKLYVSGDKSISIRWVLFSSLASGTSKAKNLLLSDDVKAAIKTINTELNQL